MTGIERPEAAIVWELRGAWAAHKPVVLSLSDRCVIDRVEGLLERVAVTGAFVVIDGWHVPCSDVLGVHQPHYTQERKAA